MNSKKLSNMDIQFFHKWKRERDQEAGNYLVNKYQYLVDYCLQRLLINLPKSIDKDEIRSLAYEGLVDALDKFSIDRELKFETYAVWRIRGAVIDGLRKKDWLPRSVRNKMKQIEEAYAILQQKKNNSVTDEEVCEYLGITIQEFNKTVSENAMSTIISIDETTYDEEQGEVRRFNTIPNELAESPERHLSEKLLKDALSKAISQLPEKEKLVITLLYFEELKLKEIAEILNVSVSRISQIHSKAMMRLNVAIKSIHGND